MTPIRVLHFADVHIGMENFGKTNPDTGLSSRIHDFLLRMDDIIDYAREEQADLIVFAGDAFKTATPNPTFQRAFATRIKELTLIAPVILLVGNHDLQPNSSKASSIDIYHTLDVPNVLVAESFAVHEVQTKQGRVVVGTAPYPVRARLMEQVDASSKTIREIDDQLQDILYTTLDQLATQADELAGDDPRLLIGHVTVTGAKYGSERGIMLGKDVAVGLGALADPRWDYVALGHIHTHQNLTAGRKDVPPVVYAGSVERIDFGEERDEKGFCWVNLARGETVWDFVALAARPMVTLSADCCDDKQPTDTLIKLIKAETLTNAIVRIRVDLTTESAALLRDDKVRECLREAGVYHIAAIEHRLARMERLRLGASPEGMTHEELLAQYLGSKGYNEADKATLMELALPLMEGSR
jgi:exonuclease SbcD